MGMKESALFGKNSTKKLNTTKKVLAPKFWWCGQVGKWKRKGMKKEKGIKRIGKEMKKKDKE